jgi:peroxiredoxin
MRSRWTSRSVATVALITAAALQGGGNFASGANVVARVGSPAPDFTLTLFNGKSVTLSNLKGKPVVVNFWHSGWPHCQREAPVLEQVYKKYRGKGVVFLSVNVTWDNEAPAKKFAEEYHLSFPVGRDADGRISDLYGIEATPTTLFIGKDGKLRERLEGAPEDIKAIEAGFEQRINWLLAGW